MDSQLPGKFNPNLQARKRIRELGIIIGKYPTGKLNAITDVAGVKVGHSTVYHNNSKQEKGPARTGVTMIMPNEDIYNDKLIASSFVLNGAGEVSGLTQVNEWGLLETPIGLTNTMSVGKVSSGIIKWMSHQYQSIWHQGEVVIPVVGECDDSFLNNVAGNHIKEKDVFEAITAVASGKVAEGTVGAGTGMICCDLKGGIGTASRQIIIGEKTYLLGVLVLSNFGDMEDLSIANYPIGKFLAPIQGNYQRRSHNYGSIIEVIATDLPLSSLQLNRLCKRAALGIGRCGSYAAHGSGEIIVGFSTANRIRPYRRGPLIDMQLMADEFLNPAYGAIIEATEEAIVNSISCAVAMDGVGGHQVPAMDLQLVTQYFQRLANIK